VRGRSSTEASDWDGCRTHFSREPLWVTGEVTDWQGHSPEAIKAMKDSEPRLR